MKTYIILLLSIISFETFSQTIDTVKVYDHYCESSNPHEIDTTFFWYETDTLFIRNVHSSFCAPEELKASLTTKNDSIKIIVYNPTGIDCLADCSFGYTIKLRTGVFDFLIIQIFDEIFTVKYSDIQTGIEDLLTDKSNIYPNPVSDYLNISLKQIEEVSITDLYGITMLRQIGSFNRINISQLQNGIYLVKIKSDNKIIIEKIVKK